MQDYFLKFKEDTRFFFTDFHKGSTNIFLHLISFIVLFKGLIDKSILLVILGFAVFDELGHLYNYFFKFNKDPKYNPVRMIPYQILYPGFVLVILLKIFNWY